MTVAAQTTLSTDNAELAVYTWPNDSATWIAILVHGYGEHLGRYDYVADRLVSDGAVVVGPDHQGHGRSSGDRVSSTDYDTVVDDLHAVIAQAAQQHPGLPVVLVGHSMGGMIGVRYAQRFGTDLVALVLSGPVLGSWSGVTGLLDLAEIPDDPLDITTLSREESVGRIYEADPLVWHGPFKRETVQALKDGLATISAGGDLGALPTLWVHGAEDVLVPVTETRAGIEQIRGSDLTEQIYPGARHEVFNETNRDEVLDLVSEFARRHVR